MTAFFTQSIYLPVSVPNGRSQHRVGRTYSLVSVTGRRTCLFGRRAGVPVSLGAEQAYLLVSFGPGRSVIAAPLTLCFLFRFDEHTAVLTFHLSEFLNKQVSQYTQTKSIKSCNWLAVP